VNTTEVFEVGSFEDVIWSVELETNLGNHTPWRTDIATEINFLNGSYSETPRMRFWSPHSTGTINDDVLRMFQPTDQMLSTQLGANFVYEPEPRMIAPYSLAAFVDPGVPDGTGQGKGVSPDGAGVAFVPLMNAENSGCHAVGVFNQLSSFGLTEATTLFLGVVTRPLAHHCSNDGCERLVHVASPALQ
jgi:hypothetical protein